MQDLLFLAHRIPYPPNKGDKLRSFHLLRCLSRRYRVHLGAFVDDPEDWQHADTVRRLCAETYFVKLNPALARLRSMPSLIRGEPLTVRYYRDRSLARWTESVIRRHSIRRILTFSSSMAQYALNVQGACRVADMVDVDSAKWQRYALDKRWPLSWIYRREGRTLLAFERDVAKTFDASVFVSAIEARLFADLSGVATARIFHASNGVDTEYFSPHAEYVNPYGDAKRVLVFTGAMDYWPNVDAVQWFASEVFPRIRQLWDDARLYIVGARPDASVLRLGACPGITVTGTVPDVRPYIAHASAVVAPLRIARGVQNKVLEGMAMGRTVIASPHAAEGIDAIQGSELAVASTTDEYVAAIRSVFAGACDLGREARARTLKSYSWEINLGKIAVLLDGLDECYGPTSLQIDTAIQS